MYHPSFSIIRSRSVRVDASEVKIQNVAEVLWPDRAWEKRVLYDRTVTTITREGSVGGGEKIWEFLIALPSTVATSEEGKWGRITGSVSYQTPLGVTRIESTLPIFAVLNPYGNEDPRSTSLAVHDHTPDLGVFDVNYSCRLLTVGSPLLVTFSLPHLPS
ncbi:hypothetical protein BT69DRAFT_1318828, partial [Atractiella rhizophila]